MRFEIIRPLYMKIYRGCFYTGKPKVNYVLIRIYEVDT